MTAEEIFWLFLWVTGIILMFAYSFEYFRYKTVKPKFKRHFNYIAYGWLAFIGVVAMVYSPFAGIFVLILAAVGFAWDQYIVDKMPGNN